MASQEPSQEPSEEPSQEPSQEPGQESSQSAAAVLEWRRGGTRTAFRKRCRRQAAPLKDLRAPSADRARF